MSDFRYCIKCGANILGTINFCPRCGAKQDTPLSEDEFQKDPYKILQVSPDAEPEVIEAAYRSLARKYHPDVVGSSASDERMREINWANEILTSPTKKDEWARRQEGAKKQSPQSQSNVKQEPYQWQTKKPYESSKQPSSRESSSSPSSTSYETGQVDAPRQDTKRFSWALGIIGIVLFCLFLSKISSAVNKSNTLSNYPLTSLSTATIAWKFPSPTPKSSSSTATCLNWREISYKDIGKHLCVYGTIYRITPSSEYNTLLRFNNMSNGFIFYDKTNSYGNIENGDCVAAEGYIEEQDGRIVLNLNGILYKCPPSSTTKSPPTTNDLSMLTPIQDCVRWDEVTFADIGKTLCVYGKVKRWLSIGEFTTVIRFSENASDFQMYDVDYWWADLKSGECVMAEGIIERTNQRPALNINGDLYDCGK